MDIENLPDINFKLTNNVLEIQCTHSNINIPELNFILLRILDFTKDFDEPIPAILDLSEVQDISAVAMETLFQLDSLIKHFDIMSMRIECLSIELPDKVHSLYKNLKLHYTL